MNNMINIKYKYRNKEGLIKFALEEKIRDACTKVAMQLDIDMLISFSDSHHINISTYQHFNKTFQLSTFIRD